MSLGNVPWFQQILAKYMNGTVNTESLWGLIQSIKEFLHGDNGLVLWEQAS